MRAYLVISGYSTLQGDCEEGAWVYARDDEAAELRELINQHIDLQSYGQLVIGCIQWVRAFHRYISRSA